MTIEPYKTFLPVSYNQYLEYSSSNHLYFTEDRPFGYYELPSMKKTFTEIIMDDTPPITTLGKIFNWIVGTKSTPGIFSRFNSLFKGEKKKNTVTTIIEPLETTEKQNFEPDLLFKIKLITAITFTVLTAAAILEMIITLKCHEEHGNHIKEV